MEHPCPKCGTPVEDGTPFCRHCRAPQIRVAIEPTPEISPRVDENHHSSEFIRPPTAFTPEAPHLPSPQLDWSDGLPCAAMGGFLALFLSIIPPLLFGPALLAAGAFAVFLYHRRTLIRLNRRAGALLGAASGGFAFLFSAVVIVATIVYTPDDKRAAFVTSLREASVAQLKASHYDQDTVRRAIESVNTGEWLLISFIFVMFVFLLICVIGASIGGAWYSAWQQKRDRG